MEHRDKVRLNTYRPVWSQERVIYQIERVRLPFPVTFRQVGVFVIALLSMILLSRAPLIEMLSPVLRYAVIPGALTWFLTNQRLDGKPPLRWLQSMVRHAFGPKRLNRLAPMPTHPGRLRLRGSIGYRLKG
jgi:hypothetical protein